MDGRVDLGLESHGLEGHLSMHSITLLKLLLNFMLNISKVSGEKICNLD